MTPLEQVLNHLQDHSSSSRFEFARILLPPAHPTPTDLEAVLSLHLSCGCVGTDPLAQACH